MAMQIHTEVIREGKSHFNLTQYRTVRELIVTEEVISAGLAHRLATYALNTLDESGFLACVQGWKCIVSTLDGNDRPADREYHVRFQNDKGGYLEVYRIFTRKGWPFLDHGINAGRE